MFFSGPLRGTKLWHTYGCTRTCIPTQPGTRLCQAGTLCNREGVWWECGVAGEMGSFLNSPSAALRDGHGGGRGGAGLSYFRVTPRAAFCFM